ncbi:MAG: helix-hairpin-helix domain-containing protein [Candidatus Aureabacteria bacterium]|nr:helix-hairpin-helix domain-containing protein [Candidatus Auribacterota bacterium]
MNRAIVCLVALFAIMLLSGSLWAKGMLGNPAGSDMTKLEESFFSRNFSGSEQGSSDVPLLIAKKKSKGKKKAAEVETSSPGGGTVSLDINKATEKELTVLPLVDKDLAKAIVTYRQAHPFKAPEDIMNVPGVGPAKYRIFKRLIKVGQPGEGAVGESPQVSPEQPAATAA